MSYRATGSDILSYRPPESYSNMCSRKIYYA
nr:MAG TPA: hypothetical protein [Caudoviricetes sp.]